MKRTYICTKEEPLHKQISAKESLLIEELEVKGYLDNDEDYELLTEMSGEKGLVLPIHFQDLTWAAFTLIIKIWQFIPIHLSIVSDWRNLCFQII